MLIIFTTQSFPVTHKRSHDHLQLGFIRHHSYRWQGEKGVYRHSNGRECRDLGTHPLTFHTIFTSSIIHFLYFTVLNKRKTI